MQGVVINKALFVETGTYNDMVLRPYQTNLDSNVVKQFQEVTNGGTAINSATLAGVANQFIRPTAQAQNSISIDHGWATPRLRFIIDIQYQTALGPSVRKILQGYTSHVGIGSNGFIDPNMVLYFNNVTTLRQSEIMTPHGLMSTNVVSEANQLLRGNYTPSFLDNNDSITWTMRPEDVFKTMGRLSLGNTDVADLRVSFAESPLKKSKRKNNSASHYVSDIMGCYDKTFNAVEMDNTLDYSESMNMAGGLTKEDGMYSDPFFNELLLKTSNFTQGGFVTYGELNALSPELDQRAKFIPLKNVTKSSSNPFEPHRTGQTEHWHGSNNETLWATILSHSIPSIMMDLMLTRVAFMATNQTINGEYVIKILDVNSFAEGINLNPYIDQFLTRLKSEILKGISSNNLIDFNITVMVDVLGETRLTLAIAGGPPIEFATPSFCDGLFSMLLTNNSDQITNNAFDLQTLSDNMSVSNAGQQNYSSFSNGGNDGYI